jgi:hypothetical protein
MSRPRDDYPTSAINSKLEAKQNESMLNIRHSPTAASVLILVFVSALRFIAQQPIVENKSSRDPWEELRNRTERIKEELEQPNKPEWAGIYATGDGFGGETLYVAPKSGFVYRPFSDFPSGIFARFDYGNIEIKDGHIYLRPTRGNFDYGELYFVSWGERHFALTDSRMKHFLNLVNAGCDQFQSRGKVGTLFTPAKLGEYERTLRGTPTLPISFRKYLFESPLTVAIRTVGNKKVTKDAPDYPSNPWMTQTTEVVLDKGESDGIWVGMQLFIQKPDASVEHSVVLVTSVTKHSANAKVRRTFEGREPTIVTVATKLTSRLDVTWFQRNWVPQDCW